MAREHAADLDDQSSPRSGAFGPERLVTCGRLLGNTSGHEARHQGRNEHRPPSSPVGLSNGIAIGCGRTAPGEGPGRGRPCVQHAAGTARATSPRVGIHGVSVRRAVAGLAQESVRTRHRHHRWGASERPPCAGDGGQQDLRGRCHVDCTAICVAPGTSGFGRAAVVGPCCRPAEAASWPWPFRRRPMR